MYHGPEHPPKCRKNNSNLGALQPPPTLKQKVCDPAMLIAVNRTLLYILIEHFLLLGYMQGVFYSTDIQQHNNYVTTSFVELFLHKNNIHRPSRPWSSRLGRLIKTTLKAIFEGGREGVRLIREMSRGKSLEKISYTQCRKSQKSLKKSQKSLKKS